MTANVGDVIAQVRTAKGQLENGHQANEKGLAETETHVGIAAQRKEAKDDAHALGRSILDRLAEVRADMSKLSELTGKSLQLTGDMQVTAEAANVAFKEAKYEAGEAATTLVGGTGFTRAQSEASPAVYATDTTFRGSEALVAQTIHSRVSIASGKTALGEALVEFDGATTSLTTFVDSLPNLERGSTGDYRNNMAQAVGSGAATAQEAFAAGIQELEVRLEKL